MIRETELNLFVPSPELLVRLASGDRPLGIRAGPPRIRNLRETYFDTPDQALRRRGMTCKLRQEEGGEPDVVVTLGEGPDSGGITSRSRLTASAVGTGVFEALRGDSEPAIQIQKFVDPGKLRPQIALDIQRLGRVYRRGLIRRAALLLYFDRITVRAGGASAVFHELRIRRRQKGGPTILELGLQLRDRYHLFPDGLSTLQRAHRILGMEGKVEGSGLSPYALCLAWAAFWDGRLALRRRGSHFCIPTFRGSGEDAARALSTDVLGKPDLQLIRLGTTEPRAGRPVVELWAVPDPGMTDEEISARTHLVWMPWHELLEEVGREDLRDPVLVSALLLLTRRKLMGQLPWIPPHPCSRPAHPQDRRGIHDAPPSSVPGVMASAEPPGGLDTPDESPGAPDLGSVAALLPLLRMVENRDDTLAHRLRAASDFSRGSSRLFREEVTEVKGRVLSADFQGEQGLHTQHLDLISIRFRGMADRLGRCLNEDFIPALEAAHIHLRSWTGLMNADRRSLLEHFESRYLPGMTVAPEWGPSFIPDMPPAGCAVGLMARTAKDEATRFFHLVLGPGTPSFLPVPGTTTVLPLEEVIRGYFFHREPGLEKGETHLFRFTTGETTVREPAPPPERLHEAPGADGDDATEERFLRNPEMVAPPPQELVEARRSIVVRILVHRTMPESQQAQLLRALERQVRRRDPLIGWSDLYSVHGPLDLSGLEELLELRNG